MEFLQGDERLDFLLAEKLRIVQSPSVFSFSLDAVLLAHFSYIPARKGSIVDLCSGNGVVPLLLSKHTEVPIYGVEIQPRLADMARRSIAYNQLEDKITMLEQDLKTVVPRLGKEKHTVVTCNPPYFKTPKTSKQNPNEHLAIARHEIMCTLEDTINVASALLKQGGKANFVHRPERLLEILDLMRHYRLEPKRVQFVHPLLKKEANMVLVEGIKDGREGVRYLPPMYVHEEAGGYTDEVREILYGESK
ncbi:tRNA1(Val) (adenine(37)-N6)-methyltransferase [Listeria ilorinensis]|uniref:tRNA1(Val) (adenine(37)-N6)-methyltransferase n=1 Tax=Listeria ilorinensis TaxID=2867439 RepID=UPI001EF5CEBF|nr:tRNA1(Val) (adenine(37)-N6)-methyltransferase [Listeria ilorinensis]